MAQFLSTLEPGQEVIFELFGHVQELLQDICDGQSSSVDDASLLLSSLKLGGSPDVSSSNGKVRAPSNEDKAKPAATKQIPKPSRRPREKSSFWNTPPKNTPSADAFPKLSSLLEKARKSLPAAEARSEFLRLMDKAGRGGRVMLVTGETGCGKVSVYSLLVSLFYFIIHSLSAMFYTTDYSNTTVYT
jgi:ATP-dependent RNA helicase DHX57